MVERLNGIEKVRGSTPLISTIRKNAFRPVNSRVERIFCFVKPLLWMERLWVEK